MLQHICICIPVTFTEIIKRLIEAHDEGGNGMLEYEELLDWVDTGLAMSRDARL